MLSDKSLKYTSKQATKAEAKATMSKTTMVMDRVKCNIFRLYQHLFMFSGAKISIFCKTYLRYQIFFFRGAKV